MRDSAAKTMAEPGAPASTRRKGNTKTHKHTHTTPARQLQHSADSVRGYCRFVVRKEQGGTVLQKGRHMKSGQTDGPRERTEENAVKAATLWPHIF